MPIKLQKLILSKHQLLIIMGYTKENILILKQRKRDLKHPFPCKIFISTKLSILGRYSISTESPLSFFAFRPLKRCSFLKARTYFSFGKGWKMVEGSQSPFLKLNNMDIRFRLVFDLELTILKS